MPRLQSAPPTGISLSFCARDLTYDPYTQQLIPLSGASFDQEFRFATNKVSPELPNEESERLLN